MSEPTVSFLLSLDTTPKYVFGPSVNGFHVFSSSIFQIMKIDQAHLGGKVGKQFCNTFV